MEFTDDEIREELARLGYQNVPSDKLAEFKKDLLTLIQAERSKTNSLNSSLEDQRQTETDTPGDISDGYGNSPSQHRSVGLDKGFRENWDYNGGEKELAVHSRSVKSSDDGARSQRSHRTALNVPGSYALHELPIDVHHDNRNNNTHTSESEGNSSKRMVKRKTSRTLSDGCRQVDESFTESETDGILDVYERIKGIALRDGDCDPKSKDEPPYRIKSGKKCIPSFIRPKQPPHEQSVRSMKPFERQQMYQKMWQSQPAPGEANRAKLCRSLHQRMLHRDDITLDRKTFVPNNYVVPTEKKRNALKWRVRSALANYERPQVGFFHEI